MSTFSPKRPKSQAKDRYTPVGPNVTFVRTAAAPDVPGTPAYGIQEIPVKKPLKARFERQKTELNIKNTKSRPTIRTYVRHSTESSKRNPIAMNPIVQSGQKKDTPTFRTSPGNPLSHHQVKVQGTTTTTNGNTLRLSSRFAARFKFEAAHSKHPVIDENRFASQKEAFRNAQEAKSKERVLLKGHPHGVPKGVIYHTRTEGLSLPGFGFGSPSGHS